MFIVVDFSTLDITKKKKKTINVSTDKYIWVAIYTHGWKAYTKHLEERKATMTPTQEVVQLIQTLLYFLLLFARQKPELLILGKCTDSSGRNYAFH